MRKMLRLTSMIVAAFILHLSTVPCFAAGKPPVQGEAKVTTNDPQFIPLTEEQEIKTGVKWYWYLVGLAVIGGAIAAAGGGGGTTTTPTPPSTGTVTGTW